MRVCVGSSPLQEERRDPGSVQREVDPAAPVCACASHLSRLQPTHEGHVRRVAMERDLPSPRLSLVDESRGSVCANTRPLD